MRVGFFGGTFDPPHLGHEKIARAAADQFGLAEVLWAPAGRQPLKRNRQAAAFADRLAMVRLACGADERFKASDLDAPRPDGEANYTVDTLRQLRAEQPGAEVFALAGADSFADLGHWREPAELLRLAEWIVVSRPGFALEAPQGLKLTPEQQARVHLLDAVHADISATSLRQRLRVREPCDGLLAPVVARYIHEHGLYRNGTAGSGNG